MKRVLVVGDPILDQYIYGTVSRVNPEAPHSVVFDVIPNSREVKLGGALNVAANIRGLYHDCEIDFAGPAFHDTLLKLNIRPINIEKLPSEIITKTRYVYNKHHMLRVDSGSEYKLNDKEVAKILAHKIQNRKYDIVVISDYNKGTITSKVSEAVVDNGKKIIFDVKKFNNLFFKDFNKFYNVIFKCNKQEFESEISAGLDGLIIKSINSVVKTCGSDGCVIYTEGASPYSIPAPKVDVADVVGAGDTFLAGMAANYLETGDWNCYNMSLYGVRCASEKVKHFGTHIVKKEDLK
jgi:rfaE bifunctional protein kinase chain/domain